MRALPLLLLAGVAGCATASGETRADDAPVVVELFTSQGCSSCPPADELLARLAHAGQVNGRRIAPLAFHVDYWNDLGWADPFSLPAWTERQRQYANALGDDRVYTPELVVAGARGMVGSQSERVIGAIATAPKQQPVAAKATWAAASVTVEATAPADADVLVAIYEDGTKTKVTRGENSGSTLGGERVVRRLERVAEAGKTGRLTIALGPWQASGAVAFAQRRDKHIVGATLLPH
ncbi:MAG TPA: DUF1223 domain-containing protein [Kofleriaceae bacterium]|nr:DUF1223 domain-containing protein [Kofleriaceae bacterium]